MEWRIWGLLLIVGVQPRSNGRKRQIPGKPSGGIEQLRILKLVADCILDVSEWLAAMEVQSKGFDILGTLVRAGMRPQVQDVLYLSNNLRLKFRHILPRLFTSAYQILRKGVDIYCRKNFPGLPTHLRQLHPIRGPHFPIRPSPYLNNSYCTDTFSQRIDHIIVTESLPLEICKNSQLPMLGRRRLFNGMKRSKVWIYQWKSEVLQISLSICVPSRDTGSANRISLEAKTQCRSATYLSSTGLQISLRGGKVYYPQLRSGNCTFRVVPSYSEQMDCARDGRIDRLQELFALGIAAPTDRDAQSLTLIHVGEPQSSAFQK